MGKKTIVAFDFDGTLTVKDTFFQFILFVYGRWKTYIGLLLCLPVIVAYLLNIYPNSKAKQVVFRFFFKGMSYESFKKYGKQFSAQVEKMENEGMVDTLKSYHNQGNTIIVISASVVEWIAPWCETHDVDKVIGTIVEVSADGKLTGRFLSKNCYGREKVNRLKQEEPNRDSYYLIAYGDSAGDRKLIEYANEGHIL